MIAAEDAENHIMKDTDLLPKDKEEELKLLAMLKHDKIVSLGKVDREPYKRIAKKKARNFKKHGKLGHLRFQVQPLRLTVQLQNMNLFNGF